MQPEELKQAIQKIKMWQRSGERAPHKPLLLLYALGRLSRGEPRQMIYREVKDDLKNLLDEFGPPRASHLPSYPFVRLSNDRLPHSETAIWQVVGKEKMNTKIDWSDHELIDNEAAGGFTDPVYILLKDNQDLSKEIAMTILHNNFPNFLREAILEKVGLNDGAKTDTEEYDSKPSRSNDLRSCTHSMDICSRHSQGQKIGEAQQPDNYQNNNILSWYVKEIYRRFIRFLNDKVLKRV